MTTTMMMIDIIICRFWKDQDINSVEYKNYSLTIMLLTASVLTILLVAPNLTFLALSPYMMTTTSTDYLPVSMIRI